MALAWEECGGQGVITARGADEERMGATRRCGTNPP